MTSSSGIHVRNAYANNACMYYPVVIVGAGASGIAMGCRLKEILNFDQYRIFDRQSGLGGTWWINRYPGVACDVYVHILLLPIRFNGISGTVRANGDFRPTALYSFSFAPNYTSTQIYPSGQDYVEYLYNVAEKYRILDKVQLNTDVTEIRYVKDVGEWEVKLTYLLPGMGDLSARERQKRGSVSFKEETIRAKIVISCVGVLVEPNAWPSSIPGTEVFEGEIIHSARWQSDTDLNNKDVIVVGSGCSAAQIVPSLLQTDVKTVTQIMRTPPWVSPRIDEPFGKEAYARYAPTVFHLFPVLGYTMRCIICLFTEFLWSTIFQRNNVRLRRMAEKKSLAHMRSKVPKMYQKFMTPDYSYGCKRRVFDSDWLESMSSPKFKLTVHPLKELGARSVTLGRMDWEKPESVQALDEVQFPADVIVLANGFEATRFLHPLNVYGRHGLAVHNVWAERGGAQAYMGTAIDGFPNFFMTVGPNTFVGHSSVILGIESTVGYILKLISPVLQGDALSVEPKMEAALRWTADIQRTMQETVFADCKSWYNDDRGWNSTMYPRSQLDFALRCHFPRYSDWTIVYTRKGLFKTRVKQTLGNAAFVAVLASLLFYARMSKKSDLAMLARSALLRALTAGGDGVARLRSRVQG